MTATHDSLIYIIAFAKSPEHTVYRDQAKLLIESIVLHGQWLGEIVVFTNLPGRFLADEMPERFAKCFIEKVVPFNDFDSGKDGKLPSARFRIHAWKHFDEWKGKWFVVYLDTDCIVRGPLADLLTEAVVAQADIMGATVANRNMARSKWFNGHITPEYEARAERTKPVQSGTIVFRGSWFKETCLEWEALDTGPSRPGVPPHLVTDQSSHNLLHLIGQCGGGFRSGLLSSMSVASPDEGQRRTIGHNTVNAARVWHCWHIRRQEDRVVAMTSELERLSRKNHPAPGGLIGKWRHKKPGEGIENVWEFHPDGLITVDEPAICGRWEWVQEQSCVLVDWLWGWEQVNHPDMPSGNRPAIVWGTSFRNGNFSLEPI